jgi:molybdate transport system substrate-binding protein
VLSNRIKKLAVGLTAAFMMSHAPAHAAPTLKIAVAPNFAVAANNLAAAFAAYYSRNFHLTYSVALVVKSDAQIQADIIAGGTTPPYDLYLGSSPEAIVSLALNLTSAEQQAGLIASAFIYAKDGLDLYSPSIDVTGGLPYPLTTNFVMPSPATDNYGVAAALVLGLGPWHIPVTSIPGGYVQTEPTVGTSYAALKLNLYPYGFVARSQICRYSNGTYTYPAGSYHYEYTGPIVQAPLLLTGVTLANTARTATQNTALANLAAYLTGTADSTGVTTTQGQTLIQSYCFALP